MDVKDSVRAQFGAAASDYAASPVHTSGPDLDAMLAAAALRGNERVLDVGCGTGHTALSFASGAREVVALDLVPAMLEQGRRLAAERGRSNLRFERGDAEKLPYEADAFDLATSRLAAHHYPNPRSALCEVARVLRPGGTLLLVDTISPEDRAQDAFLDAIERTRDPSHVRNWSVPEWESMLAHAGFAPGHGGTWWRRLDFAAWVERMHTPPEAVARLKRIMDAAPLEVKRAFGLGAHGDYDFDIPIALLRGELPR